MKKKSILAITVSVLLILAAVAAGLNAVYTVLSVTTRFSVRSDAGREESRILQEKLDGYSFPWLKVEEVKKNYPRTVELRVSERLERYAVERTDAEGKVFYSVLDADGIYLYDREKNENRLDGAPNILLNGFGEMVFAAGERTSGAYVEELLASVAGFRDGDVNVRLNLVSVTFEKGASDSSTTKFTFRMQEGTRIEVNNLTALVAEKTEAAFQRYLTLEDEDKMFGVVTVNDDKLSGGFNVSYTTLRDLN